MRDKFIIFAVFAFVVQTSFALELPLSSCRATAGLEADLAVIQFGEDTAHQALQRAAYIIFTRIMTVFQEIIGKVIGNEDAPVYDVETFLAELLTAFSLDVRTAADADRTIEPGLDVDAIEAAAGPILEAIIQDINNAIISAETGTFFGSLAEIERNERAVELAVGGVVGNLSNFTVIANFSAEDRALIDSASEELTSTILDGFRAIFHGIRTLLAQRYYKTSAGESLLILKADREKAYAFLRAGISKQYGLLRNVYIAIFLRETGILCGLYALQSVHSKPVVELFGNTYISTEYV